MPKTAVIDVSHHQIIESFQGAKDQGIVGVIHKLTEGTSYVDSKVDARFYLANEAGMKWGMYHFLRPGDMRKQAKFFTDKAKAKGMAGPETLFAADHEDSGVSREDLIVFLQEVQALTGRSPVIYSGHVLKEQGGNKDGRLSSYRLWLAQYASKPTLPAGFDSYWLWQHTDEGEVPGIDPPTDLNACWQDDVPSLLASWSGGAVAPPEPVFPEDADVVVTMTITVSAKGHPPVTATFSAPLVKKV